MHPVIYMNSAVLCARLFLILITIMLGYSTGGGREWRQGS